MFSAPLTPEDEAITVRANQRGRCREHFDMRDSHVRDAQIMSECSRFIAEHGHARIQFARAWIGLRK